jgi:hypothetical protein
MCRATVKDFDHFAKSVCNLSECMKYAVEWEAAILFGWEEGQVLHRVRDL